MTENDTAGQSLLDEHSSSSSHGNDGSCTSLTEFSESKTDTQEARSKIEEINGIYARERDKRIRRDGVAQYVDTEKSEKFRRFAEDCWFDGDHSVFKLQLETGAHSKFLIVGAGFGGLSFAVRLIEAGFKVSDLVIIDTAAGFGGCWYWNRFPGLMCDVESYVYMPLLEETGYMPQHKYAYGPEVRKHADRIAKNWALEDRAMFRTRAQQFAWNDRHNEWDVELVQLTNDNSEKSLRVTADFVIVACGFLHRPKLTKFDGIDTFRGHCFHTARWDYNFTGGSPEDPRLVNLKDKKVGIVGTGVSGVQAVPQLAQWCKQLYVFQRTPASVDVRAQRPTDAQWWFKETHNKKGWQRERIRNFTEFTTNAEQQPSIDKVNDGWTKFPGCSVLVGTTRKVKTEDIPEYVAEMQAQDLTRSERIRDRVQTDVDDADTADKLKHQYHGWCKRPTFHDEYLSTFNLPNVTLVDTDGKGISDITESGIVANGQLYDLDLIVFSTGFLFEAGVSPPTQAAVTTYGRNGRDLEKKWLNDLGTLHGIMSRDFPNLFFHAVTQGAGSASFTASLDTSARHTAFIITQAMKRYGHDKKITIEPTADAEQNWTEVIMDGAAAYGAPAVGCTPSYYNAEGLLDNLPADVLAKMAKAIPYPYGLNRFNDMIDEWHKKGDLSELDIRLV